VASRFLPVKHLLAGTTTLDLARDTGVAALGANVMNNLPTLLVAFPALGHHAGPVVWSVLLGVNMGPVVVVSGSLASLLWLSSLRRLEVKVGPADFTRAGVVVGLPAAMAALAVASALQLLGGAR
jgi:arsenical pump membrane protein